MHPIATPGGDTPSEGLHVRRVSTAFVVVALVLTAICGAGLVHVWRSTVLDSAYASSLERLADARSDLDDLHYEADARARTAATMTADSRAVVASAEGGYLTPSVVESVAAAAAALDRSRTALIEHSGDAPPSDAGSSASRGTASALLDPGGVASRILGLREEHAVTADEITGVALALSELDDAAARAEASRSALFLDLADRAAELVAVHSTATNRARISLLEAGRQYGATVPWPADTAQSVAGFVSAARALERSAADEAAEAGDPSFATKAEIEAYARSISFGVPLDISWQEGVNGRGGADGWLSGSAEWYGAIDDSWADLTLSDSIAEAWADGPDARALVTHEVGHTQVMRPLCRTLYDGPDFLADDEAWATAWAIGMGHDVPGSGESAYGRPTDEQIAAAALCR